jgi:hypothetical protein
MSMKSILYIASLGLLMIGCKREDIASRMEGLGTEGKANVKIIHASAYATNYSAHLRINGVKVSGAIANATPFPGGGLNTAGASQPWYLAITPGNTVITLSVSKAGAGVGLDSFSLYTGGAYFGADRYYSAYLTDTAANTQLVILEDNLTLPPDGFSRFKFVNLMPNQLAMDLYQNNVLRASNIIYKETSPDFLLAKGDTARWFIRPAGAAPTSAPIAQYPANWPVAAQTISNQRVMTIFSRGYKGITTGNRLPNVSLLYNY